MTLTNGIARLKYFDPKKAPKIRVIENPRVEGRVYGNSDTLQWKEEELECKSNHRGAFYDAVHATLKRRKKFPIDPRQVREMMRIIGVCRRQNPDFSGK